MIIVENYAEKLVRTYSDESYKIMQAGTEIVYDEAVDPVDSGRTYTETTKKIDGYSDEATAEDYENALRTLGVDV